MNLPTIAASAFLLVAAHPAGASLVVTWSDQGSDLVATWSGSFDTTPYTFQGGTVASLNGLLAANPAPALFFFNTPTGSVSLDAYRLESLSTSPGIFLISSLGGGTSTGNFIGIRTDSFTGGITSLDLPAGYTSGSPLAGTVTFPGTSVASVFGGNLAAPRVMFDDGTNTVTFDAIPEPSACGLILLSGALGLARRRRAR